jgi:hypothetical protein
MSKPRRPLDQQLAREFIFGNTEKVTDKIDELTTERVTENPSVKFDGQLTESVTEVTTEEHLRNQSKAQGLASEVVAQFKVKEATTRITIDLPKSQHLALASLAKHLDTSINTLGRTLIERFLDQVSPELKE